MSVNGITSTGAINPYSTTSSAAVTSTETTQAAANTGADSAQNGVIYEASSEKTSSTAKTYKADTATLEKLKADAEARTAQLRSLVEQLILKQGNTYNTANDIWSFLREGNFTVDAATKAQAEQDISEDGYWGVEQTSDRIIDFATALTGGDPDKIESMREAFKKGYEQAQKTWGGELPEISQKTYDAVMKKFDKLAGKTDDEA